MPAFERNLGDLHDLPLPGTIPEDDVAVAYPCAPLHFFLAAKPEDWRACACRHGDTGWIVGIEYGEVASLPAVAACLTFGASLIFSASLIFKDARFSLHVDFESAMPVEMVGRHVQHDCHLRTESLNRFQLKARNLEHDNGLGLSALGQRNRGRTDVAAHQRGKARRRHDLAGQRGGCRLAVRSSDGNDGS